MSDEATQSHPRNTKFVSFATLLAKELQGEGLLNSADDTLDASRQATINKEIEDTARVLIAQRTYDHMYAIIKSYGYPEDTIQNSLDIIPDMTEFPK